MLRLFHTYENKILPFKEIKKGFVGLYTCGPTVYDFIQLGNARTYVWEDFLSRTLKYLGYKVKHVMNVTDVGHLTLSESKKKEAELNKINLEITDTEDGLDRIEKAAKREGLTVWEIAEKYTVSVFGKNWQNSKTVGKESDFGKLNILRPTIICKATENIKEQIEIIKILEKKGFTYKTKHAVYFDTTKFPRYEELLGQNLDEVKTGERAFLSDPERKNLFDFRLWQLNQPDHQMQWDSPWGRGFPGWHIECSAMSRKYLGQPFDIHTGGEDHIKNHHINEIAQSESAFGTKMANYWLHSRFLVVNGKRMGKSLGNFVTLEDIKNFEFDYNGKHYDNGGDQNLNFKALRYFFYCTHYRTKQNFTWEALKCYRISIEKLFRAVYKMKDANLSKGKLINSFINDFREAIEDDLNSPKAIAVMQAVLKSSEKDENKLLTLLNFDQVIGLGIADYLKKICSTSISKTKIEKLIQEREIARKNKDFKKADAIRERLKIEFNVEIEDSKDGTKWNKIC